MAHALPHLWQACDELVIIIQQGQGHVRPPARERFDRPRVHRAILQSLKYERRLDEPGAECIVPQAVFVESEIERPLLSEGVMEERERPFPLPLLHPLRRQEMMSRLREHHGRRHEHQPVDALAKLSSGKDRQRAAKTRADERNRRVAAPADRLVELAQHPRHGHRAEVRTVEIGTDQRLAALTEAILEVFRLRGLRRRGEPVQVEDHSSRWQSFRHRHLISPSPSVL